MPQNAEVFAFTYGALVTQLIKDYEDYSLVNDKLDKMGFNIGVRLIDDFLAKTGLSRCQTFLDTAHVISKVGFKMFLNITPAVTAYDESTNEYSLVFDQNPLNEFVELPPEAVQGNLWYSNVLCGVIRGALEMVQMQVEAHFIRDVLRGDKTSEIRIKLINIHDEEVPVEDD
ncbi:hypothetical protein EV182_001300 [Spiromyces aspiralis]|uniref:Uncharacterized protein n=1 Tax=Spiromyces aspiralis TaxID=68401 RepID=A0ACC1HVN6_9FUNG|nr:hypothetical protein EV182_001300 [Spiromyces aspiralis]